MTAEEIRQAQAMLKAYQGKKVPVVSIPYDQWMRETTLGLFHPRGDWTLKLDEALKKYDQSRRSEAEFVALKLAFNNWVRAQEQLGRNWRQSDRNRSGIITKLYDQIMLEDAALAVRDMAADAEKWEAVKAMKAEMRNAIGTYFRGRTLDYKDKLWKPKIITAINTCERPILTTPPKVVSLARSGVTVDKGQISNSVNDILGGQDPTALFTNLGTGFDVFAHALGNLVGAAKAPAEFFYHIYRIGKLYSTRSMVDRERFNFSRGDPDAALNAIITLLNRDLGVAWVNLGEDIASIVTAAFVPGVAAIANTLVDFYVHLKLYATMAREMESGNKLLHSGPYDLNLFQASPLLGCCYLSLASAGVWLNFPVEHWGVEGFMDAQAEMYEKALPVIEQARKFIRLSRCALSGTEYLGWVPRLGSNTFEVLGTLANTRPDRMGPMDYVAVRLEQDLGVRPG